MNYFFHKFKHWILLFILIIACFSFFYFDLYEYLDFNNLKIYQATAQQWTTNHYFAAVGLYLLVFTALIACTIPCATFFTLLGGFLFGSIAILYAVIGTTLGGLILFLAVRTAIGARITAHRIGWIKYMESGFQKNAFHYLLLLRLIPIFPCWISNISAGALNVPMRIFLSATIIGILPATIVYALAGRSLDELLSSQQAFMNLIFSPSILLPLLGLAILSIFPVIYKSIKNRDSSHHRE